MMARSRTASGGENQTKRRQAGALQNARPVGMSALLDDQLEPETLVFLGGDFLRSAHGSQSLPRKKGINLSGVNPWLLLVGRFLHTEFGL